MALSKDQLARIQAAKAAVSKEAVELKKTYFGTEFVFKFKPKMSQNSLDIIARVAEQIEQSGGSGLTHIEQIKAVTDFLDSVALPETAELIAELGHEGIIDVVDLMELERAVMQELTSRPFTRSSSSSGTPSPDGTGSTPDAPEGESTPEQTSLPTGS